jgi:hypothetical protein
MQLLYNYSYGNVRFPYGSGRQSNTVVLIHDAFQPLSYWQGFMPPHAFEGVALDTHIYRYATSVHSVRSNRCAYAQRTLFLFAVCSATMYVLT